MNVRILLWAFDEKQKKNPSRKKKWKETRRDAKNNLLGVYLVAIASFWTTVRKGRTDVGAICTRGPKVHEACCSLNETSPTRETRGKKTRLWDSMDRPIYEKNYQMPPIQDDNPETFYHAASLLQMQSFFLVNSDSGATVSYAGNFPRWPFWGTTHQG